LRGYFWGSDRPPAACPFLTVDQASLRADARRSAISAVSPDFRDFKTNEPIFIKMKHLLQIGCF
jgi:hypothetical protein